MLLHQAQWAAPKQVRALTTTIQGGVSEGPYQSLNLGLHVDDDPVLVERNRTLLHEHLALPSEPVWLNQVHGTDIIDISDAVNESLPTADGTFSFKKNKVCAILTADCLPVFFTNKAGDRVALVHAGWRSLAGGIVESVVAQLGCSADDILVWAGPCIGPAAFEIGDEVRQQLGGFDLAYKPSPNSRTNEIKWLADLYALTKQRLLNVGVNAFTHSNACTYHDEDTFFSYRRHAQCGRMASLIWFE